MFSRFFALKWRKSKKSIKIEQNFRKSKRPFFGRKIFYQNLLTLTSTNSIDEVKVLTNPSEPDPLIDFQLADKGSKVVSKHNSEDEDAKDDNGTSKKHSKATRALGIEEVLTTWNEAIVVVSSVFRYYTVRSISLIQNGHAGEGAFLFIFGFQIFDSLWLISFALVGRSDSKVIRKLKYFQRWDNKY